MLNKRSKTRDRSSRISFKPLNQSDDESGAEDIGFSVELPNADRMSDLNNVGLLLRADRLRRGEELAEVAKLLRIQYSYLSALEDGRFEDLPEGPYAVGFVRTYAEYLGLDALEIVRRFKQECRQVNERSELVFPTPEPEARIPSGAVVMMSVMLAASAYGGWYYLASQDREMVEVVEPVPERLTRLIEPESPAAPSPEVAASPLVSPVNEGAEEPVQELGLAVAELAAVEEETVAVAEPEPVSVSEDNRVLAEPEPVSVTEPVVELASIAVDVPVATEEPDEVLVEAPGQPEAVVELSALPAAPELTPAVEPSGQSRVTIRATDRSWVRVVGADDRVLLTRMLLPGEVYEAPNVPELSLQAGNAGALQIEVDGTKVPPIGGYGEVVTGFSLSPDDMLARIGTAH